jgi:hypothetical protein
VTRADLPPGVQAGQAVHAAVEFTLAFPALARAWHDASNTVVLLSAPDELTLAELCADAEGAGLRVVRFHEPDLGGALTAAGLEPAAARLLRRLPLTLSRGEGVRT